MKFSTTLLSLALSRALLAHDELLQVPAPSVVEECDDRVGDFVAPDVTACPEGLPGTWTECMPDCAASLQAAVTMLDCCTPNYLNEQFANGADLTYAFMAFPNVIDVCDLDITGVKGCATDQCDLNVIEFQSGMMPDVSSCQQDQMPGNWSMCDATCASALQMAVTNLSCCAVDFLETFVGLNEQDYATSAFPNVIEQCDLDVDELKGCAVDQCDLMVIEYQSTSSPDVSSCSSDMPGNWTTCDEACAMTLQSAIDTLDCCTIDFLETFVGLNEQAYATMAFPNVIEVCSLNVTTLTGGCLPDECAAMLADFETPIDVSNTTCDIATLPGNWTACDEGCAASIQSTVDDLGCCTVDFLGLLAGGDQPEYAAAAFDHVMDLCNIDISNVDGSCVDDASVQSTDDGGGVGTLKLSCTSIISIFATCLFLLRD